MSGSHSTDISTDIGQKAKHSVSGSLDDVKRRILARVPLAELIGERIKLETRSGRPIGCCPFHAEKTPSFYIYDDRYFCFGCKASGDAIEFVRKTEGVSYVETLRFLAGKYGIEAPELDEARGRMGQHRAEASLYKMMADAQEFYVANLEGPNGAEARAYLERRGFSPANIKAFGFGLTPIEGYGLLRHLRSKGHRDQDMIDCSLATASSRDGRPYDFLRHRVTIPIRDPQGRLIAFGGRSLGDEQPKYKNSTNTKLFDKSHTLFGLDTARRAMREKGRAIVVEGYMDALQLWQQGYPEAVACLGTAFTEGHLRHLKHATSFVVLLFDGDGAGRKATLAAVNVALTAPEVQVRAVALSDGLDPDDFVRKQGGEALEPLLAKAEPLFDYVMRVKLSSTEALAIPELLSKEFIPWLARLPDRVQRDFLATRIAAKAGVPVDLLVSQMAQVGDTPALNAVKNAREGAAARPRPQGRGLALPAKPLEAGLYELFGHLYWGQPGDIETDKLKTYVFRELEVEPELLEFMAEIVGVLETGVAPASRAESDWSSAVSPQAASLLVRLRASESAFTCVDRPARIDKIIAHFKVARVKGTIASLKAQIARLTMQPGKEQEVSQLLKTVSELSHQLR